MMTQNVTLITFFMKKSYSAFSALSELLFTVPDKPIDRWFRKLEDRVSVAPSKSLQRHMRIEVVDELVKAVSQNP